MQVKQVVSKGDITCGAFSSDFSTQIKMNLKKAERLLLFCFFVI